MSEEELKILRLLMTRPHRMEEIHLHMEGETLGDDSDVNCERYYDLEVPVERFDQIDSIVGSLESRRLIRRREAEELSDEVEDALGFHPIMYFATPKGRLTAERGG